MAHNCGKCPVSWTGDKMCHCRTCHRTFTTVNSFDLHRVGSVDNRSCDVDRLTENGDPVLAELRPGVWGRPRVESASDSYCVDGKAASEDETQARAQ